MLNRLNLILIIIILVLYILINNKIEYFDSLNIEDDELVPKVEFPFKNILDQDNKRLNIILISAPFRTPEHEELYLKYKSMGLYFCGISSYLEFPDKIINPYEDRFHE